MKLHSITTPALLLIFAGIVVFAGIFTGQYYFKGYNAKTNAISDLGQRIDPINNSRTSSIIFNVAMVVAGIAIAISAHLLHDQLHRNFLTIPLFIHGIATAGVGIFPSTIKPTHLIIAVTTFVTIEFTMVVSFWIANNSTKYLLLILGITSIVFLLGNFTFKNSLGIGEAERLIVYPTTIWLIVFGIYLISAQSIT